MNFKALLKPFRKPAKAGGKLAMDESNKSGGTTTPAPIDMDALGKLLKTHVEDAMKPLNDRLAAFEKAAVTPAAKTETPATAKTITESDIDARVEAKLTAARNAENAKAAREAYAGDKLKDLPAAYRNQLGTDPAKFDTEATQIRDSYKADLKASGFKVPDVAGVPNVANTGVAAVAATNLDQNSSQANIAAGLRQADAK